MSWQKNERKRKELLSICGKQSKKRKEEENLQNLEKELRLQREKNLELKARLLDLQRKITNMKILTEVVQVKKKEFKWGG